MPSFLFHCLGFLPPPRFAIFAHCLLLVQKVATNIMVFHRISCKRFCHHILSFHYLRSIRIACCSFELLMAFHCPLLLMIFFYIFFISIETMMKKKTTLRKKKTLQWRRLLHLCSFYVSSFFVGMFFLIFSLPSCSLMTERAHSCVFMMGCYYISDDGH